MNFWRPHKQFANDPLAFCVCVRLHCLYKANITHLQLKPSLQAEHYTELEDGFGWLKARSQHQWTSLLDQKPHEVAIWPSGSYQVILPRKRILMAISLWCPQRDRCGRLCWTVAAHALLLSSLLMFMNRADRHSIEMRIAFAFDDPPPPGPPRHGGFVSALTRDYTKHNNGPELHLPKAVVGPAPNIGGFRH